MSEKLSIKDWAEDDRPREKFLRLGPSRMSNAELFAILIGSGNDKESAVGLMQRIMSAHGNSIRKLGQETPETLMQKHYRGIGEAKSIIIAAACELVRRGEKEEALELQRITSSQDIYDYFWKDMAGSAVEQCHVLLLNQGNRIIGSESISQGGLTSTVVDIRVILRRALMLQAPTIALCHNHPSGNLDPSQQDDQLTSNLQKAARIMQIRLLDHLIFTDRGYFSYADQGRL